jgi:4'-phosphopantetheinyl transferase
MTRDVAKAVPDERTQPVVPDVLDSLLNTPVTRGAGGVAVWRVPTETLRDEELHVARDWLDEGERQQASSYVRAELRRAYEIAHAAARLVVGAVSDTPPEKVVWGRHACPGCGEPHGRPRAEGSGIEFSLSHTPGQVLVAVADVAVGVDVERHPDDPVALAKLLHPRELEEIEAAAHGTLDGGRATVRFTRAWARTEAYLKGIGIGLGRDPHLDYLGTDGAPSRTLGAWSIRDVDVPEGYGAAVAVLV